MPAHSSESGTGGERASDGVGHDWDITSGVGFTALAVAAGRAMESSRPDPLVRDRYAEEFVAAAGSDGESLPTAWPPRTLDQSAAAGVDPRDLDQLWTGLATYMGVRSRFFDEFFRASCADRGIRQVVLLAAGLDTRAHRLNWPHGTVLFEVDHPNVLSFKDRVLCGQPQELDCSRRSVGVDLRADWPSALKRAGFDPDEPTAFLSEGLLPYLSDTAKQELTARVHDLSAPTSRWAIELIPDPVAAIRHAERHPVMESVSAQLGVDIASLWPAEQHWTPQGWLVRNGWSVDGASVHTVAARYERELDGFASLSDSENPSVLLTATREVSVRSGHGPDPWSAGGPRDTA